MHDTQQESDKPDETHLIAQVWKHPWGRVLMASITIAVVFWALRETAFITMPLFTALRHIILPLAIGMTLAYILSPLVDGLRRLGLPRFFGTLLIFTLLSFCTVLVLSFTLPSLLRQSVDLGKRLVTDAYYLELDDGGRFSRSELRVLPLRGQTGMFFEDLDGDGVWSPGEPQYDQEEVRIRFEPSLLAKIGEWIDRQTGSLRRIVGFDMDETSFAMLAFYDQHLGATLEQLDQALSLLEDERDPDTWPSEFRARAGQTLRERFSLAWPGVDERHVREALEASSSWDEVTQQQWTLALRHLLADYHRAHREVIQGLQQLHQGGGADSPLAVELRQFLSQESTSEQRQQVQPLLERLQRSEMKDDGHFASDLLALVRASQDAPGSTLLRDLALHLDTAISSEVDGLAVASGSWLRSVLVNIPTLLSFGLNLILIPIYAFFLTMAMPRIRLRTRALLETYAGPRWLRIAHSIERVIAALFRGRLIVCALCTILLYLGFLPLQVPYSALFAVLIGLATAVPLAGLLFLGPALLLMLVDGGSDVVIRSSLLVLVYTVVQTLEATVLTPLIMGREVELHPVILIIALLFFGSLFGILGLILAVPIAATVRIMLNEFVWPRLRCVCNVEAVQAEPTPPCDNN